MKLFNGPMWRVEETTQCDSRPVSKPGVYDPMKVCMFNMHEKT